MENSMKFKPGSQVTLTRGISDLEKELLAKGHTTFTVSRIDKTHGYIVVADAWGTWHIHPEALELR